MSDDVRLTCSWYKSGTVYVLVDGYLGEILERVEKEFLMPTWRHRDKSYVTLEHAMKAAERPHLNAGWRIIQSTRERPCLLG